MRFVQTLRVCLNSKPFEDRGKVTVPQEYSKNIISNVTKTRRQDIPVPDDFPYDSPAWQLASCRPTNTAKAQRQLCEYMPLRPCAIYDLCKTYFTSRVGGITVIYQCVVIHSAFELGLLVAKLRYIYDTTKKKNLNNSTYCTEGG